MASEAVEEAQVPPGLLDQPVLVEGKRKRKATNHFNIEVVATKKRVAKKHAGTGTKLQDIPSVDYTLTEKFKADDLRMLYKLCFEVSGKASTLKRDLKQFQGFEFAKDSGEYKKKKAVLGKMTINCLNDNFCAPLCLAKKGSKEEVVDRILEFLLCPTDSGKAVAKKKAQQRKKKEKKEEKKSDSNDQETKADDDDATEDTEEQLPSSDADKDEDEEKEEEEDDKEE